MAEPLPVNRLYLSQGHAEPVSGTAPGEVYYLRSADGRSQIVRQDAVEYDARHLAGEFL